MAKWILNGKIKQINQIKKKSVKGSKVNARGGRTTKNTNKISKKKKKQNNKNNNNK